MQLPLLRSGVRASHGIPAAIGLVRVLSTHSGGQQCMVLDGVFALFVQAALFFLTVGTLVVKWLQEVPRRSFYVFLLDCSKQIIGAGMMHIWNLASAIMLDKHIDIGDECSWYWLNIMVDTTFGVIVAYYLLQVSMGSFKYDTGHYMKDGELDYTKWVYQVGHWLLVVTGMKIVCVAVIFLLRYQLHACADFVLGGVQDNEEMKLIVVMIVTPGLMNAFQFCCQDQFLKWKGGGQGEEGDQEAKTPLTAQ